MWLISLSTLKKESMSKDSFMSHLVILFDKNHLKAVTTEAIWEMCQTFPLPPQHMLEEVYALGMRDAVVKHLLLGPHCIFSFGFLLSVWVQYHLNKGSKQNWNLMPTSWKKETRMFNVENWGIQQKTKGTVVKRWSEGDCWEHQLFFDSFLSLQVRPDNQSPRTHLPRAHFFTLRDPCLRTWQWKSN